MVLKEENLLWFQKSREKWIKYGDRNTKFFHIFTLISRKRNKVEGLKDDQGIWCFYVESLKAMAVRFFLLCILGINPSF